MQLTDIVDLKDTINGNVNSPLSDCGRERVITVVDTPTIDPRLIVPTGLWSRETYMLLT